MIALLTMLVIAMSFKHVGEAPEATTKYEFPDIVIKANE